jgi:endo-1,4-beta-xylanase
MMKQQLNFYKAEMVLCLTLILMVFGIQYSNSQTYCTQPGNGFIAGVQDGYRYELWNQFGQGTACITLDTGALFSGEWDGIQNYLARRGLGYDQTQEHQEIGTFYSTYNCDYNPSTASGNSYLSIYGWTVDPLIEYYIIEDWRNWIPSMADSALLKDTIHINGSIYDIYENTRINKPSILGDTTFQQYFSIRRDVRNSGTINISEHFNKWESLGMDLGKMYEVSFVVEGYQSNGNFDFTALEVIVDNSPVLVNEESTAAQYVSMYPNPNSGTVFIELDEAVLGANIRIFDTSGRMVYDQENEYRHILEVSNLESGMYFVNVNNKWLNTTSKLLVNRID